MDRIQLSGVEWRCREGATAILCELPWTRLRRPRELPPNSVAKDNRLRTVARLDNPREPRQPGYYVKRHKFARTRGQAKHLLVPWRLRREWMLARRLRAEGVPTPRPIAYGERWRGLLPREAFYITREIPETVSLKERLTGGAADERGERSALERAAWLTAELGNHGLYHLDYHAENILLRPSAPDRTPYIMDLHDLRRGCVTKARMRRMLAMMANSLGLPRTDGELWHRFMRALLTRWDAAGEPTDEDVRRWCETVERRGRRLKRRHLRSRTRRCIKESTTYTSDSTEDFHIYRRRDFPVETALRMVEKHRRAGQDPDSPGKVLKSQRRGTISLVSCRAVPRLSAHRPCPPQERTPGKVCVKAFRAWSLWKRLKDCLRPRSRAVRAWMALQGFAVRDLPAPRPLAVLERRHTLTAERDYLVMEVIGNGENLRDVVTRSPSADERRELAARVAEMLSRLDRADVYHPDLKPSNFLVWREDGRFRIAIADMSRVSFESPCGRKRWVRWLYQLNRQMPPEITLLDRLRCLRACNAGRWSKAEESCIAREVLKKTRERRRG